MEELTVLHQNKPSRYTPEMTAELRRQSVSYNVNFQLSLMKRAANSLCDFNDLEDVQERTTFYFEACAQAGITPKFVQLCTVFGKSEQAAYEWMRRHPAHQTTLYLKAVASDIVSILEDCSLDKSRDTIMSLFILKNSHCGLSDNPHNDFVEEPQMSDELRKQRAEEYRQMLNYS